MSLKKRTRTDYIVVHCAATPPTLDIGRAEIDRWHRQLGWLMIGYHYIIRRDGTIEKGRDEAVPGSHVAGYNANSVGVCLVGGVDAKGNPQQNYTPAQYAALTKLLRELKARYPHAEVLGHRDFPKVAKACPCFDVRRWVNENKVFSTPVSVPKTQAEPAAKDGWTYHTVVQGDTLWAISRKYGVSVDVISALNPGTNPQRLQIGQSIRVR